MTLALIQLAILTNVIGALLGTAFTTYAEIYYTIAASDGRIDHHERKYLRHLFRGLRFGMTLVLLSGIALIVLEYLVPSGQQAVLASPFWMLETLIFLVLILGRQLSEKRVTWWLGSAGVLSAWWMILLIDFGVFNQFGYLILVSLYVLTTLVVAGILGYIRMWLWHPTPIEDKDTNA